MSNINVRNAVSQIAQQIESLARQVQDKLAQGKSAQGGDLIGVANELVRNSSTFTFALGELFALEDSSGKKVQATAVSNPSGTPRNYHNVRDSLGRFRRV
jgi:hypothetical protein